ncbi:MAG: hypothetical protein ACOCW3_04440 [Spirochaetota bacterium]
MSETVQAESGTGTKRKIYCANCKNCKLVPSPVDDDTRYVLRVRCAAGKWRKRLGGEKLYKYFTVIRRSMEDCDSYEPMGDEDEFLQDLKRNLPINDEVYESDAVPNPQDS